MSGQSSASDIADAFAPDEVFRRIDARVAPALPLGALDRAVTPLYGDHRMNNGWDIPPGYLDKARAAAVLIALVEREDGLHVLFTKRTSSLRDHAGQVAFPGGKMDPDDASPADTALREANEEVGLPAEAVDVRGYLDAYLTGSGYRIIPVVARVTPPSAWVCNPAEVVEAFEVPFAHLMSAANHELRHRVWNGAERAFYAIPFGERTIWGITAGIVRVLYERLYL